MSNAASPHTDLVCMVHCVLPHLSLCCSLLCFPTPRADLVRAVRGVLDELGPAEMEASTDALNRTKLPRRFDSDMRMDRWGSAQDPP
jgi:hypothetical protein